MHHVWVTNFVGLVICGLPPRSTLAGAMRACLLRRGESKIRRYVLEHDLLEALIALPEQIFYNTGIATYV